MRLDTGEKVTYYGFMRGRPATDHPLRGKNSIRVEVTPEELKNIDAAASADGRWRGAWCRRILVAAAKKIEKNDA